MRPIDVLFLCETNAATSLMAEAWVNHRGDARIRAFSAGRTPAAAMLAEAREILDALKISTESLEPKSLSIFALPGSRRPDVIIDLATVTWTAPELSAMTGAVLRWPLRDPSLVDRRQERRAVADVVFKTLVQRLDAELLRLADMVRADRPTGRIEHLLSA